MKNNKKNEFNWIFRYLIILASAIPSFWIFYLIFTPLTFYPVYFIMGLFYEVIIQNNYSFLIVNHVFVEIVPACISGSAYFLILVLNLGLRNIDFKKRIVMLSYSFGFFYIINLLRIIAFSFLYIENKNAFYLTHILFWYVGSIFLVLLVWFSQIKLFKIKEIPFVLDLKKLYENSKFKV